MLSFLRKKYRTLNTAKVSESALRHNLKLYQELCPNKTISPVLKGNAYGHGLLEVASILDSEGVPFFVVDSLYEAYKLKKNKIKTPVLILGYTHPENLKQLKYPFHFAVGDLETAQVIAKLGMPAHIEVDTGMSRMGFSMEELPQALKEINQMGLKVEGLFTHFADADNPEDDSFTNKQSAYFKKAIELVKDAGFKPKWIHTSNSAGALKCNVSETNMVRLGFSLYGISPYKKEDKQFNALSALKPVLEIHTHLVAVRKIKKGDRISYNGTFQANRDMTIGILPLGYYEALPRSLSNQYPFLGRICMNHSIIEVNKDAQVGDRFTLYGKDYPIGKLAEAAHTIPYELMTRINESMRREVV